MAPVLDLSFRAAGKMKTELPGSPFSEPTGLLELFTSPQSPYHLLQGRRICCVNAPLCCCQEHDSFKENGHSERDHRLSRLKRSETMKTDTGGNKPVLGERNLNLFEDPAAVDFESFSDEIVTVTDAEDCPSGISETILNILDQEKIMDDNEAAEMPPYHPVSAPFSPRPQFRRLKQRAPVKAQEMEQMAPYDPDFNPLSPRPEFRRYTPMKRFLQERDKVTARSLIFPDDKPQEEAVGTVAVKGLKRSISCPELPGVEGDEEVPMLETADEVLEPSVILAETLEEQENIVAKQANVVNQTGRMINWGRVLRRALVCLFLLATVTCIVLLSDSDLLKNLQHNVMFRTREWTMRREQDEDVMRFLGNWDIITTVSNQSLVTVPEVREEIQGILLPSGDVGTFHGGEFSGPDEQEQVETGEAVDPLTDDDTGTCSTLKWEEDILQMCLDKNLLGREETDGLEGVAAAEDSSGEAAGARNPRAVDGDGEDSALLEEITDDSGDEYTVEVLDETYGASTLQGRVDRFISTLCRKISRINNRHVAGGFSLLGVITTMFMLVRRKQRANVDVRLPTFPGSSGEDNIIRLRPVGGSLSEDILDNASNSASSGGSNTEEYGSFTTMEEVGMRGHLKITPVRRSSRLRGRNAQSPMLKA